MIDLMEGILEEFAAFTPGIDLREGFLFRTTKGRMALWRAGHPLKARAHYLKNLEWRAANVERCREYRRRWKARHAVT